MTTSGMRPLLLSADGATAQRACTDDDAHTAHAWSDGRRAWSCQGRAGHRAGRQELADVVELSLAG